MNQDQVGRTFDRKGFESVPDRLLARRAADNDVADIPARKRFTSRFQLAGTNNHPHSIDTRM